MHFLDIPIKLHSFADRIKHTIMKNITYFILMLALSACTHKQKQELSTSKDLWTFDVTKEYPTKEIYIQDIADVDYIPLETNDSMLWLGQEQAV